MRVWTAILLTACAGAPAAKAPDVAYNADYSVVWNAVAAEMHDRFPDDGVKIEDAQDGLLVSKWKSIPASISQEEDGAATDPILVTNGNAGPQTVRHNEVGLSGDMIQLRVRVVPGGPPWKIIVDGEGAHHAAGDPVLKPYVRHASDEPVWVDGRIEDLRGSIYRRLKAYAVALPNTQG